DAHLGFLPSAGGYLADANSGDPAFLRHHLAPAAPQGRPKDDVRTDGTSRADAVPPPAPDRKHCRYCRPEGVRLDAPPERGEDDRPEPPVGGESGPDAENAVQPVSDRGEGGEFSRRADPSKRFSL